MKGGFTKSEFIFILFTFPITIVMNLIERTRFGERIGNSLPYRPRFINWIWATYGGYFWLPCPICGRNFGGHEWKLGANLMDTFSSGKGVCSKCIKEAEKRNIANKELFDKQIFEAYSRRSLNES